MQLLHQINLQPIVFTPNISLASNLVQPQETLVAFQFPSKFTNKGATHVVLQQRFCFLKSMFASSNLTYYTQLLCWILLYFQGFYHTARPAPIQVRPTDISKKVKICRLLCWRQFQQFEFLPIPASGHLDTETLKHTKSYII